MLFCHKKKKAVGSVSQIRRQTPIPRDIIVSNKAYFLFDTSPHPVLGQPPCLRSNCR